MFCWKLEADRQEQINKASGEAAAMLAVADARARGLLTLSKALQDMVSLSENDNWSEYRILFFFSEWQKCCFVNFS